MPTMAAVMLDLEELKGAIWSDDKGDALAALNALETSLRGLRRHVDELASKASLADRATSPNSEDTLDRLQMAVGLASAVDKAVARLEDHHDMRAALLSVSVQLRTRLALVKDARMKALGASIAEARAARAS